MGRVSWFGVPLTRTKNGPHIRKSGITFMLSGAISSVFNLLEFLFRSLFPIYTRIPSIGCALVIYSGARKPIELSRQSKNLDA
jgi:hypothetical protein